MADTGIKKYSKLYICATPQGDDLTQTEFEALTWVEVGNVVTLPEFGVTDSLESQSYVNGTITQKHKGDREGADTEVVVGYDMDDGGQTAMRTAAGTRFNYALKLEGSDAPDASTTNTIRYSRAVIGGPSFGGGEGSAFDNETYQIGLNQVPIIVDQEAI